MLKKYQLRTCFLLLITFLSLSTSKSFAQEFEIKSFSKLDKAFISKKNERIDFNGEKCAMIKIYTNDTDILLTTNRGIEDTEIKNTGEMWIWVSPGERYIKFQKKDLATKNYQIPIKIKSNRVYALELSLGGIELPKLLSLTLRFNVEGVSINREQRAPVSTTGKIADLKLPVGEYKFTFQKNKFEIITKTIHLSTDLIENIDMIPGGKGYIAPLPSILSIMSLPSGAEIYLNNQKVGVTPYARSVFSGKYDISIKKEFYITKTVSIDLKPDAETELPLVELKANYGKVSISTKPIGASVSINNKEYTSENLNNIQLENGIYTIKSSLDMYHTSEKTFTVSGDLNQQVEMELKPAFGHLKIESEPLGASVYVDDKLVGLSPWESERLPAGKYRIRAEKNMWATTEDYIEVKDGEVTHRILSLSKDFAEIEVIAKQANIYLNDSLVSSNMFKGKLKTGNYTFKATRYKYNDDIRNIYLGAGSNQKIELNPQLKVGTVSFITTPNKNNKSQSSQLKDVNISLNGNLTNWKTPISRHLAIGHYIIDFKKENYLDVNRDLLVEEGKTYDLIVPMTAIPGELAKYKRQKTFWFLSTLVTTGAGIYAMQKSNALYDDYQAGTSDASDLHSQIDTYDKIAPIAFGVAGFCFIKYLIKGGKKAKVKRKMKADAALGSKSGQISLTYNF